MYVSKIEDPMGGFFFPWCPMARMDEIHLARLSLKNPGMIRSPWKCSFVVSTMVSFRGAKWISSIHSSWRCPQIPEKLTFGGLNGHPTTKPTKKPKS